MRTIDFMRARLNLIEEVGGCHVAETLAAIVGKCLDIVIAVYGQRNV